MLEHTQLFSKTATVNGAPAYIAIPNTTNPRVVLPIANKKSFNDGYKIHNVSSLKNRILKKAIISFYPLSLKLFGAPVYPSKRLQGILSKIFPVYNTETSTIYSFYIGTPGPGQKLVVKMSNKNSCKSVIAKVAFSGTASKTILTEANALRTISTLSLNSVRIPKLLSVTQQDETTFMVQEYITQNAQNVKLVPSKHIYNFQIELASNTNSDSESNPLLDLNIFGKKAEFAPYLGEINLLFKQFKTLGIKPIAQHGDFVPYNLKLSKTGLVVYDWEFFEHSNIPLFDVIHLVYQGHIQIKQYTPLRALNMLKEKKWLDLQSRILNFLQIKDDYLELLWKLYMLKAYQMYKADHFFAGFKILVDRTNAKTH